MQRIDLHVHTTASDGTLTPREVVSLAAETGLSAIAITDHDTFEGCRAAMEAASGFGVEIVPGIEISTRYQRSVHILGYYIDLKDRTIRRTLDELVDDRSDRNRRMAELMQADGINVDYDDMVRRFGTVVGRPHFATILVEQGYAATVNEAFEKYVNKGCKYYLPRSFIHLDDSIKLIADAGGIPVLAHPFQYKLSDDALRVLIEYCRDCGLQGLECRYSGYDAAMVEYLEKLADDYGLLKTGGSDFHGTVKPHIHLGTGMQGELDVPYDRLQGIKDRKGL